MSVEPVLFFNHIPKCYGQSLRRYFAQFMATHTDYEATFGDREAYRSLPYDTDLLTGGDILMGHFVAVTMPLANRYPEVITDPRFHCLSFLRDPMERQISQYYYSKRPRPNPPKRRVEDYTLNFVLSNASNVIASCFQANDENYHGILDRYFFLGVAERHVDSMKVLVERIFAIYSAAPKTKGVERVLRAIEFLRSRGLPHENRTARDRQVEDIPDEVRQIFLQRNALDYKMYEIACRRLDADMKELGIEPSESVAQS